MEENIIVVDEKTYNDILDDYDEDVSGEVRFVRLTIYGIKLKVYKDVRW